MKNCVVINSRYAQRFVEFYNDYYETDLDIDCDLVVEVNPYTAPDKFGTLYEIWDVSFYDGRNEEVAKYILKNFKDELLEMVENIDDYE